MLDIGSMNSLLDILFEQNNYPVDTGRKLNVHKMFRRRPGRPKPQFKALYVT